MIAGVAASAPAVDNLMQDLPRHESDDKFVTNSSCFYFSPLKEPGRLDTSATLSAMAAKFTAPRNFGLKSVLKKWEYDEHALPDRLDLLESRFCRYDFPPCPKHDRKVFVDFSSSVQITTFVVSEPSTENWKSVKSISTHNLKRHDSSNGIVYSGNVFGYTPNPSRLINRKSH